MLSNTEELFFIKKLRNRELVSATLLRDLTPQEWLCHTDEEMIVVRWQQGILGMGLGESEHETYGEIKIVAIDDNRTKEDTPIKKEEENDKH